MSMRKSPFPTQDEHETGFGLQKRCFPSIICNHDNTDGRFRNNDNQPDKKTLSRLGGLKLKSATRDEKYCWLEIVLKRFIFLILSVTREVCYANT